MKLGIGTAQFGMPYGVANKGNVCTQGELLNILKYAQGQKIHAIDTAPSYGNAQLRLGSTGCMSNFRVITKVSKTDIQTSEDYRPDDTVRLIKRSLDELSIEKCYGILCHDTDTLTTPHGRALLSHLASLKQDGYFKKVGVSIYDLSDVNLVLRANEIDIVQLPLNLFDQRFFRSGAISKLKDNDIEIHIRSAFLQGLLLMPLSDLKSKRPDAVPHVETLQKTAHDLGQTPLSLALGYLSSIDEIDLVIVGVNNQWHLTQIITASKASIDPKEVSSLALNNPNLIDPRRWE